MSAVLCGATILGLAGCGGGGGGAADSNAAAPAASAAASSNAVAYAAAVETQAVAAVATAASVPSIPVAASPDFWLQTGNANDAYWIEDNRWGQGSITEGTASTQFEQKVGVSPNAGPNGEVAFRLKWRWPNPTGSGEVKGYPAILSGKKPGYASDSNYVNNHAIKLPDGSISQTSPAGATPGTIFPMQLPLQKLKAKATIKHNEAATGKGHLSYDIWLQSNPKQDKGFTNSSITHEIMIPLTSWGGYGAHNQSGGRNPTWYDHDAVIGGKLYHVYITKKSDGAFNYDFGSLNGNYGHTGWKMIAFVPDVLPVVGEIDLAAVINYLATRKDVNGQPWANGNEYLSSVELGVEPEVGSGDITVYDYQVTTR